MKRIALILNKINGFFLVSGSVILLLVYGHYITIASHWLIIWAILWAVLLLARLYIYLREQIALTGALLLTSLLAVACIVFGYWVIQIA